jgi:purine-binding chemotaxis protein CheW
MSELSETQDALVRFVSGDMAEQAPEEIRRVILFQACDEWFALPIEFAREVQPLDRVIRVPTAPAEIQGVLNIRGRVLTLFGLAACLGISPGTQPDTHIIVLDLGDPELRIGVAAQRIGGVRRVSVSALDPSPLRRGGTSCLEAVFETQGQVVGLLDLARVFARSLPEWGITLEPRGVQDLPHV